MVSMQARLEQCQDSISAAQHRAEEKLKNYAEEVTAEFGFTSFRELGTPLHTFAGSDDHTRKK